MTHFELLLSCQESTPVELPSVAVLNKADARPSGFKLPAPAHSGHKPDSHGMQPVQGVPGSHTSTAVISPVDDAEEELDLLLGLQKPLTGLSLPEPKTSNCVEEVSANSKKGGGL